MKAKHIFIFWAVLMVFVLVATLQYSDVITPQLWAICGMIAVFVAVLVTVFYKK